MSPRELLIEINDLAMRASDDRLSPEQRRRFNELLESSEEARRALLFCGMMEAELAVHASEEAAQDRALEAIASNAIAGGYTPPKRKSRRPSEMQFSRWFLRGALACLVLCAAVLFYPRRP